MNHLQRSAEGCLCCGGTRLTRQTTLVSPYLAFKAWGGPPVLTQLATCEDCGFRFFDRGLSESEAANYYRGYRDAEYLRMRHHYEPFYTRARWLTEGKWLRSDERREDLARVLESAALGQKFDSVLDHGGGTGHLIRWLEARRKAVFDLAGETVEEGIEVIEDPTRSTEQWSVVVSSHVFEHLNDPASTMRDLVQLIEPGGHLYMEVPDELWRDAAFDSRLRDSWLRFIVDKPTLRLAADIYSTAFRIKTGVLPPLGFTPAREHLNYFNLAAMQALAARHGLSTKLATRNSKGHFCLIAHKAVAKKVVDASYLSESA